MVIAMILVFYFSRGLWYNTGVKGNHTKGDKKMKKVIEFLKEYYKSFKVVIH